jgi:hypothetical protein
VAFLGIIAYLDGMWRARCGHGGYLARDGMIRSLAVQAGGADGALVLIKIHYRFCKNRLATIRWLEK